MQTVQDRNHRSNGKQRDVQGVSRVGIIIINVKLAHLEITIGVQEEIGWLQIPVENVDRVQCFQCAKGLPDKRHRWTRTLRHEGVPDR